MSDEAQIAGREPIAVEVTAGESYWWCMCGRSKSQPFCDSSHAPTSFDPMEWEAPETKRVLFCTCKRTSTRRSVTAATSGFDLGGVVLDAR